MAASPLSRTPAVTWIVCLQGSAGCTRDIVSATWPRCYCSAYRLPSIEPKYTTPRSTAGDDTTAPMEMKRLKSRYMSWKSPKSGLNASRLRLPSSFNTLNGSFLEPSVRKSPRQLPRPGVDGIELPVVVAEVGEASGESGRGEHVGLGIGVE